MVVWGRAGYLSVTESPHNIKSLQVSEEVTIWFFETWMHQGPGPVHDPLIAVSL